MTCDVCSTRSDRFFDPTALQTHHTSRAAFLQRSLGTAKKNSTYLIVPLFDRQGVRQRKPVPVNLEISGFATTRLLISDAERLLGGYSWAYVLGWEQEDLERGSNHGTLRERRVH